MGYFALIKDGIVTSVIVAEQDFIDETSLETLQADLTVDVSETEQRPGPGFTYDAETETFTAPE
jgi:hypothetical protein